MDPLTAGLNLALTLAHTNEMLIEGMNEDQRAQLSTKVFQIIDRVLAMAEKAHEFLHRHDPPEPQA